MIKYSNETVAATLRIAKTEGLKAAVKKTGMKACTINGWAKLAGVTIASVKKIRRNWDEIRALL